MSNKGETPEQRIHRLITQLADFRCRRDARRGLVMAGKAAVGPLADALSSPLEGVAWCAARTLGDIGDEAALGALVDALGHERARDAVIEALRKITGRDFGGDVDAWRRLVNAESEPGQASGGALSDQQLADSLAGPNVSVTKSESGFTLRVQLPNGRHQNVEMLLSLKDSTGEALVAFYTECGPAAPSQYEWALKVNMKIPFGAVALRDTPLGKTFVMVDSYLRKDIGAGQLSRSLIELASRADRIEASIIGADKY